MPSKFRAEQAPQHPTASVEDQVHRDSSSPQQEIEWRIIRHERLDSTNLELLRLAEQGAEPGTVVVAKTQTAGRGRLGRRWMDVPGRCLLMSVLLDAPDHTRSLLTAAMALAATRALEGLGDIAPRIKWPNDVLIEGRKVAGVLAEGPARGPVAVGLGINVNGVPADLPEDLRDRAGFVSEYLGHEVAVGVVEKAVRQGLDATCTRLARGESALVIEALNSYDCLSGREITAAVAGSTVRGIAQRWLPDGRLLMIDQEGRELKLEAGEVTLN